MFQRAFALALILYTTPVFAQKNDIMGVSPGMTFDDAHRIVEEHHWKCESAGSDAATGCATDKGRLVVTIAPMLPSRPIWRVFLMFNSSDTKDNIVKSISEQFGSDPSGTGVAEFGPTIVWQLRNGLMLSLINDNMLDLIDPTIKKKNEEMVAKKYRESAPTPKF